MCPLAMAWTRCAKVGWVINNSVNLSCASGNSLNLWRLARARIAASGSSLKSKRFSVRRILEATRAIVQDDQWSKHGDELKKTPKRHRLLAKEKEDEGHGGENRDPQQQLFAPVLQLNVCQFVGYNVVYLDLCQIFPEIVCQCDCVRHHIGIRQVSLSGRDNVNPTECHSDSVGKAKTCRWASLSDSSAARFKSFLQSPVSGTSTGVEMRSRGGMWLSISVRIFATTLFGPQKSPYKR
jgi:hypothetical protein